MPDYEVEDYRLAPVAEAELRRTIEQSVTAALK
jgi:hypothetical protein